jgi:EmrB/QacA subfamily drug resistance transporter
MRCTGGVPNTDEFDPRRWRALFVLLLGQFCALLDVSVTNVALPSIGRSTGAMHSELQWIVSGYVLAFGLMPVIGGRLGDLLGRRRIFLIGVTGFIVASATVGLSPDPLIIIGARVVQGLFGGVIGPQISGYIQNAFPRSERGRAFGRLGLTVAVATALGPVVGGVLIAAGGPEFGWRLVFFVNVPIGIAVIILALRWVAKRAPSGEHGSRQLDIRGALVLGSAILCILFPIVESSTVKSAWLFLLFAPAALLLLVFLRRERRLTDSDASPLLNLKLFRSSSFSFGAAFILVFFCGYTGLPLVLSLFYQQGLGFTALESGLGISAFAVGSAIGAPLSGRLVPRIGRPLVVGGVTVFFLGAISIGLVTHASMDVTNPAVIILRLAFPLFLLGLGCGCVITPNQTLSLTDVDPHIGGSAGGVLQTGQRFGSAIGQAVIGSLFFAAIAGHSVSQKVGTPAPDSVAFVSALDLGIAGSLVFSGVALTLGLLDVLRTRRASRAAPA